MTPPAPNGPGPERTVYTFWFACSLLTYIAVRLTFLLPQLIWPEPEDNIALSGLTCPGLEWLLAHGNLSCNPVQPYESALAMLFGQQADAPFGALRLLGEPATDLDFDARDGFWLCADPVHLRFHHERIILADAGAFEVGGDEARALAAALNQEFADVGRFHVADSRRWYLQLSTSAAFAAPPLSAVAGRRIEAELPADPHNSTLRSWLNEAQMFLHSHPVNASRASTGQPAINSLWLWGAGCLPDISNCGHDGVLSADPLAVGLARAAGIQAHSKPSGLDDVFARTAAGSAQLVVLNDLLAPVIYEDSRGWRTALERLEEHWFAPLRSNLGRRVTGATLITPTIYGLLTWTLKSADRWKIWRRPMSLAALAKSLAQ
ncbi:MAG: hypothetical protein H6R10_3770 [Rhodocyclaceae bacterium]|nr:hypothetical protein [Rhodocyclaceae bacterium]